MSRIVTNGDYERAEKERMTLFESREEFDKAFCKYFRLTEEQFKTLKENGYVSLE